ncbi:MAG: hypothetical protein ABIW76_04815 [Fibrobacteria bacterium]
MIRFLRAMGKGLPIFALVMAVGAAPALPSDLVETPLSPQERKVWEQYRLHCRPGGFIEEVSANLGKMQQAYPGSTFLTNSAFLAEVHYTNERSVWNGNGTRLPGSYPEVFDSLFNNYAPAREAWRRSRSYGFKAAGFSSLGVILGAANAFLGLYALMNDPPLGQRSLEVYRTAQIALPIGWISSFIYAGICASRNGREFDNAFFESNGRAIAKRLAEDL